MIKITQKKSECALGCELANLYNMGTREKNDPDFSVLIHWFLLL